MCVDYFRVATQTLGVTRTMLLHSITFSLSLIYNPKFCLQNAYLMPENELIMIAKTATYNDIVSINKCSCECFFLSYIWNMLCLLSVNCVYVFNTSYMQMHASLWIFDQYIVLYDAWIFGRKTTEQMISIFLLYVIIYV